MMNGMGMLHLEIKQHRMERDFKLKVRVGKPRVSYRETLNKPVSVGGRVRPPGGRRRACSPRCAWSSSRIPGGRGRSRSVGRAAGRAAAGVHRLGGAGRPRRRWNRASWASR